MQRLPDFHDAHPNLDLRILSNNNRVDLAGDGLDFAIRFGDGSWHGTDAMHLSVAPLSPVCSPRIAARLKEPIDLAGIELLRSYRSDEWTQWFRAAGRPASHPARHGFRYLAGAGRGGRPGSGAALLPITMSSIISRVDGWFSLSTYGGSG